MANGRGKAQPSIAEAGPIRYNERDCNLDLDNTSWPPTRAGWHADPGRLTRTIRTSEDRLVLRETVLRFPSAPAYGLKRYREHHVDLGRDEAIHTVRVIQRAERSSTRTRPSKIYLISNGLNECDNFAFYYELAAFLLKNDPNAKCLIRPFPGHLTRFPFAALAETPLDGYLWDGSRLFQQFIRHMLESQWTLSVLATRPTYASVNGANLLAEADTVDGSRLDDRALSIEIHRAWTALRAATAAARKPADADRQCTLSHDVVASSVTTLREVLGLTKLGQTDIPVHVIGYSLGGFAAQSIFMTWPFIVSTCSTLLSGGALRDLAPTSFAHPEEWQTVLHSLRYELDDALLSMNLSAEERAEATIAGMRDELFATFKRTFYEVFQQEYHGSYRSRLLAYRQRMLFVVGGNDPIVRPEMVRAAAPTGGMNLVEIAGLGHFVGSRPADDLEAHQRHFWIPQVARLIDSFCDDAAHSAEADSPTAEVNGSDVPYLHEPADAFHAFLNSANDELLPHARSLGVREARAIPPDGALDGPLFERSVDDLLARIADHNGVILVLRNEIPTVFLPEQAVLTRAASLYHDNVSINRYMAGLGRRRLDIRDRASRVALVLPWNAHNIWVNLDRAPAYPGQSETAGAHKREREHRVQVWNKVVDGLANLAAAGAPTRSLHVFDGRQIIDPRGISATAAALHASHAHWKRCQPIDRVPSLPDCWIWLSDEFLGPGRTRNVTAGAESFARAMIDKTRSIDYFEEAIQLDQVRVLTVSRARFNPRFRGKLVTNPSGVANVLLHSALCLALGNPLDPDGFRTTWSLPGGTVAM